MCPPRSTTRFAASAWLAGPCSTAPVLLLKTEPWHGQYSVAFSYCTWQPAWVQIALHAVSRPSGWRTTMSARPSEGSRYSAAVPRASRDEGPSSTAPAGRRLPDVLRRGGGGGAAPPSRATVGDPGYLPFSNAAAPAMVSVPAATAPQAPDSASRRPGFPPFKHRRGAGEGRRPGGARPPAPGRPPAPLPQHPPRFRRPPPPPRQHPLQRRLPGPAGDHERQPREHEDDVRAQEV